jgi:V/A-type H+/Na+-transporting ATPase subunit E
MGCEELIGSLRKEAEEKVREIWREAEEEAGKIQAGFSLRLEALRRENESGGSSEDDRQKVLLDAGNRARMIRLASEDRLSARLYILAVSSLHLLRGKGYENIFHRLVLEIPPLGWHSVKVNQDDCDLAKKFFPGSAIVADRNITGGMEVEAEEGWVRVANTFEKRLEREWPQMLPGLMADINREVMDDESPQAG